MKHLKLFFALFAMLALNVGNALGATYFEDNFSNVGTGTNSFSSRTGWTSLTQCYPQYNTGVRIGSSKNPGAITKKAMTEISGTKDLKVTIYTAKYNSDANSFTITTTNGSITSATGVGTLSNGTLTVKPNGNAGVTSTTSKATWTDDYKTEFIISGASSTTTIKFATNKRAILGPITIEDASSTDEPGSEEPVLSVEPEEVAFGTKNIYFESEKQGSLEIEIAGQNLTGDVTAALSGFDANIFDLSQESFTPEDGEVSEKLTVSYEVSEEKEYSATLTLSSDGVDNVELPITLKVINKEPTIYTKVTDASTLSAGDKVIFVYEAGKKAAGTITNTTGGYLNAIDITQALNTTANPATVSITDEAVVEYTLDGTAGAWELISTSGKLSEKTANATSAVDLAVNKGTKWTISIASGNATIKGTTNTIKYNTSSPRFKTYYSGQTEIQLYAISVPKYAVNFTQPEGGKLIVKNGETAITSGDTFAEGIKLTVTATPANGYEGGTVVVKDAVGNDVTATVYADGVLTMPAYAVTISATFDEKPCELLAKPTVSATTTYSSATLTWDAVTNAAKYSVKVGTAETVETTAISYEVTDLNAETEYTYQVQAIAEADQDTYCDSEVAEGTFTTATAPTATLTLKDIVGKTTQTGALNSTITLPTTAAECSKTFVGWDADENCDHDPTYAKGAEYTLAALTQTLYAVYADGEGGGNFTITKTMSEIVAENEYTVSEGTNVTCYTSLTLDENITLSTTGEANCGSFWKDPREWRLYQNKSGNAIVTASDGCSLTSVKFTFSVDKTGTFLNAGVAMQSGTAVSASGKSATYTVGNSKNDVTNGQVKITAIEVSYSKEGEYSNYSTTCAAAPIVTVNPTSVTATAAGVEGKVTVTYENVNTENVAVALFNDAACTEAFTAGWLTADLDGDKNITYTVSATTFYTERKAYIQLTAPETTGATDPDVVVIPVTQAAKEKVFASLAELVAADLTAGDEVTVTLNNDVIKEFYIYSSKRCGVVFDVQKDGKDIKIYFNNQTTIDDWAVGGKLSGTLTNVKWTTYSSAWQLAPANTWAWANLTYTEPKAVSTVVVSGAPTKTTYVDGEAFDPAGLTVTVNYNDATTEVNPTGVTFTVTPATLVKGQTSVSVTATFNSVTSAAYEVTGLTVNDIPTKTVAEFIAAGGTRCYLEGIVSGLTEGSSMKYGNFDLTDASGTIYVYGCLNASGEKEKFAELGVKNGDKIKVIADEYELYGGTKDEAKNVQYVSHVSAASITVENITMEVDEVATITATVDPADAVVTYTIKDNEANAISLNGNTITALAEGTATITATVAEGATYLGNSVDFTVTVGPKTESGEVVILAELDGKWYAMKGEKAAGTGQIAALEVTYLNGTLYNVADADKASITWTRTVVGNKVTFANNGKYLKGTSGDTNLALDGSKCEWTFNGTTYTIGNRTFLYRENFNFKNYSTEKANASDVQGNYSALPVVTAPVYDTAIEIGSGDNSTVITEKQGQEVNVIVDRAFEASDEWYTLCVPFNMQASVIGKAYQISGLVQQTTDYVEVYLAEKTTIVAGEPYLIKPTVTVDKFVVENATIVNTTGASISKSISGLSVTMQGVINGNGTTDGLYWVGNGGLLYNNTASKSGLRAYFNITTSSGIAPRMRVVAGENVETGIENIITIDTPVKVIENGQLVIIRDGVKYNVQGQKL